MLDIGEAKPSKFRMTSLMDDPQNLNFVEKLKFARKQNNPRRV
jgi:hypothetical protein